MAPQRDVLWTLTASCLLGFLLGVFWRVQPAAGPVSLSLTAAPVPPQRAGDLGALYPAWLSRQGLRRLPGAAGQRSEAAELSQRVRVLCALQADYSEKNVAAARLTWLHRCTAQAEYGRYAVHPVPGTSTRAGVQRLRTLLEEMLKRMTADDHQWLLLANQRNYVILENLRHLVAPLDPASPLYLGLPVMRGSVPVNDGDASVVLSLAAVRRLHQADASWSQLDTTLDEPDALGYVLALLKIPPSDTRDAAGRPRFLPVPPFSVQPQTTAKLPPSLWRDSVYRLNMKDLWRSAEVVSFGTVSWQRLHRLEYLVNHVRAGNFTGAVPVGEPASHSGT